MEERKAQKVKRKSLLKLSVICVVILFAIAVICGLVFYNGLDTFGADSLGEKYHTVEKKDKFHKEYKYKYVVKPGDTISGVSEKLKEIGIIRYPKIFQLVAKKYQLENILKEGVFFIDWRDSYYNILKTFDGRPEYIKLTIPEHFDFRQTVKRLKTAGLIKDMGEFIDFVNNYKSDYWFESAIATDKKYKYEGYFFPATYEMDLNISYERIVDMFLQGFSLNCSSALKDKQYPLDMTLDEVIILASMVEREAANVDEFKTVAGVFINRLNIGMRLESCATLKYIFENDDDPETVAKDRFSGSDTEVDSPYNTYKNYGLPPAPICSPGLAAIEAVLDYEKHDYLYFVATGENKSHFSRTFSEHSAAVSQYLG